MSLEVRSIVSTLPGAGVIGDCVWVGFGSWREVCVCPLGTEFRSSAREIKIVLTAVPPPSLTLNF